MPSKLKAIFSKGSKGSKGSKDTKDTKSKPDSDPKPSYTKLQSSSDSLYSVQTIDVDEEKRKAWEAKRAKEAEDYLYKHGFGVIFPPIRV